jgi:hypothetical protein
MPDAPDDRRRAERFPTPGASASARKGIFEPAGARVEARKPRGLFGLLPPGPDVGGVVLDMSATGLRFVSSEKLELGSKVTFVVNFSKVAEPLKCAGTVRWTHAHGGGTFAVGVEFDPLDEEQFAVIEQARKA